MRKGALKKKKRQLEELHLDRREALGELVLGMYVQKSWDDDIMSRGAAEVREVAEELRQLSGPESSPEAGSGELDMPPTGEYTAEHMIEHDMPETAEQTGVHELPESDSTPKPPEKTEAVEEASKPAVKTGTEDEAPKPAGKPVKPEPAGEAPEPAAKSAPEDAAEKPLPSKAGAGTKPMEPLEDQKPSELEQMEERITKSETAAKTATEAARAALAADARTELSAITREIEGDRSRLDTALKEAAGRIKSAEKRADDAEAKLARESAANREAAAGWVRSQAAEIEADAALAAEIAADPGAASPTSADGKMPELEARINSLETALQAEKASKIEALTVAESRLKAIEESAREAERRVEEAEAAVAEAGTAPVAVGAAPGMVTEAEAREAAVSWLRGQIGALRQEISRDTPPKSGENA